MDEQMCSNEKLKTALDDAELILIGIGEEFFVNCGSFEEDYQSMQFHDGIQQLSLEPLFKDVLLKRWIASDGNSNRNKAYENIARICERKNYFIVSLETDDNIYHWNLQNVVTPCGGRRRFQKKVDNKSEILSLEQTRELENEIYHAFDVGDFEQLVLFDERHKGENLEYNNIFSNEYNEEGYLDDWKRYLKWIEGTVNRKVCVLELGVSLRLPSVIRWPFEKVAFYNNKAVFFRINEKLYQMTAELKEKGTSIPENAVTFLGNLFV